MPGVLTALVLVVVVPIGLFAYVDFATRRDRAAAEAEADRTDPAWRMQRILLTRRVVPDAENSAFLIIKIADKAKGVHVDGGKEYAEVFCNVEPNVRLNERQENLVRVALGKAGVHLAEARELTKYPHGRYPIKIAGVFFMTLLPDHQKPRQLADWLKHDAWLLAHDGRANEAVDSCRACLCAARSMGDEPIALSHLIRVAIQMEAIVALERVLAQWTADEAHLAAMQQLLELEIKESNWTPAIRGERAGVALLFEDIQAGRMKFSSLSAGPAGASTFSAGWFADHFPSTVTKYYPEYLQHMTRIVEISKLPLHEQRHKVKEWDQARAESKNRVMATFAPMITKIYQAECRSQAHLQAAAAAVACERYRLVEKRWPDGLDALVRAKLLQAVPLDPIDGAPLRFRHDNGKIMIYSIGDDEKDDGGVIHRENLGQPGTDPGFRLWAPELRGK